MDYGEAAALIHYCRLIDKVMILCYNEQVASWLIYLVNMLQCENSLKKKAMTKQEYENLRKVIQAYYDKYHWRYSYLEVNNKPKTSKEIIYTLNKLLTSEEDIGGKTLVKHLEAETLKLRKSLATHSLRGFQVENECETIIKTDKSDN